MKNRFDRALGTNSYCDLDSGEDTSLLCVASVKSDKFALASEVWDEFIKNCCSLYVPGPYLTVDEPLFPSKARCPFTQYMPNKPDKFGIKFWILADVDSKYMCNAAPYLGKDELRPDNIPLGEHVVMKLAQPYLKKGRNITTDNFFTSMNLAEKLKLADTSLVGTLNRKRREIPDVVSKFNAQLFHTTFLKSNSTTITIYQGKVKKNVLVLSTLHPSIEISVDKKNVPESVKFYNSTKYGVDIVDKMARLYSTRCPTRRWPVHVFQNILDLSVINAWVLYKEVTGKKISRRNFILRLTDELRCEYDNLDHNNDVNNEKIDRSTCRVPKCKNKTKKSCEKCKKPFCGKHTKIKVICEKCESA
jgi:hypothetical protein